MSALPQALEEFFAFPCSFSQQRLWFLDRLVPGNAAYNIPAALRMGTSIDANLLEHAVNQLAQRHESLRTTFRSVDGVPLQYVAAEPRLRVNVCDLRDFPVAEREAEALRLATAEARVPFDLERGPLLRVAVLKLAKNDDILLVVTHHIVSDGWSMEIFFRELTALYESEISGVPANLPELPVQYADYAAWQREWLSGSELATQLDYWHRQLSGVPPLQLPTDRARPPRTSYQGSRELLQVDNRIAASLKEFSRANNSTLFMTLLAAFEIFLHRYSGQNDFAVGTLSAGRDRPETEGVIGFFVNTLALRATVNGTCSFREVLARVKETALEAYAHSAVPFEKLVEHLHPERTLNRNPLVQVTFQLYNPMRALPGESLPAEPSQLLDLEKGSSKFDLAVDVWEERGGLTVRAEYCTELFDRETVRRMLLHFGRLLEGAMANPDSPVDSLRLLSEEEYQRQVFDWNRSERPYPREALVHELFAAQAARTPDSIAVVSVGKTVTYRELNEQAERVAERLRSLGMASGSLVAVCMERSIELIATLIGVMKAGGAYVPIDPAYPRQRRDLILADSGAPFLILGESADPVRTEFSATGSCANGVAYVLYTSGSTGTPKGVAVLHRNASALIHWALGYYTSAELSGVLAATSVCFDLSVFELFVPLSGGGAVILADHALHLPELPAKRRVTLLNTVPSAVAELARIQAIPDSVRTINLAGEPLTAQLVDLVFSSSQANVVNNLYGPTEDTTYSTIERIERGKPWTPSIGRPLDNRQAYILDRNLQPVPVGVSGELYLGGAGVTRGYWNRPELTAAAFIASPFFAEARLYRTGDLARYRSSGKIEFLGRADQQVKVRGYRIELSEVETALRVCPGIRDGAVLAIDNGTSACRLVAYVVPGETFSGPNEIRRVLALSLPQYMIPASIVLLEILPRTPNGKLDRAALPALIPSPATPRIEPRSGLEKSIAAIWQELLLDVEPGLDDNFFEVGGHSLLLLRLQARIQQTMGEVSIIDLFRYPTIRGLAAFLTGAPETHPDKFSSVQTRAEKQRERARGRTNALAS